MSGGLKQQWGLDDPAQVSPDAQSQDLKTAFEKSMDAIAEHLQYTAVNGELARHDPLAARGEALVPRYHDALGEVDPADPAKAKPSIDSLLADTESLGQEVAAFRSETEKAAAEWQSRAGAYDAAVVQVEELQEWQHPKEGALRSLVDAIRSNVNDRACAKAIAILDQFLPKLQPIYEDFQRQKVAQQQYEPAVAPLQPKLTQVAAPSFAKLVPQQSEIAATQAAMESSAQGRDFVTALATVTTLGGRVDAYTTAVQQLQKAKQDYEQALAALQPKLQAAPNPSPFARLATQQAELTTVQQQMEAAAQAEDFEQALAMANELSAKVDAYTDAVQRLQKARQDYEQALATLQPKLQAAPNPSPFARLAAQQAELTTVQQQMEAAAQAEDFEQALQQANDLSAKANAYTDAVQKLQQAKQDYEQVLANVQPKLQASASPTPFNKLVPQQAELGASEQHMESAAQAEDFEQALAIANELGAKADAYLAALQQLQQAKQDYEQALGTLQSKLLAAPNPSPFAKLAAQQAELMSGQQQMEAAAQAEDFEQALAMANDLSAKVDAYADAVRKLQLAKQDYEQVLATLQPKLQAAPNPRPFARLAAQQAELASGQQQMEAAAQAEDFEQALAMANDLGAKVDAYTAAVQQLQQAKRDYEQALGTLQPKLQAAPNPSPFAKLAAHQAELDSGQQQMESAAQAEDFEQALQQANDLVVKVDAYTDAVQKLQQAKQDYEQVLARVQPRLDAALSQTPPKGLEASQADITSGRQLMETAAQGEDFVQALRASSELNEKLEKYASDSTRAGQSDQAGPPKATAISPAKCPPNGGTRVTITGTGFTGATRVAFGSMSYDKLPAQFSVDSDTQISATTPDVSGLYMSGSDLMVVVTTPAGSSPVSPDSPTVTFGDPPPQGPPAGPPPKATAISPAKCPPNGGTRVTITGTGFTGATRVAFGSMSYDKLPAQFSVDSDTQISATTPDVSGLYMSGSDLMVVVTTLAGSSPVSPDSPTVTFGDPPPQGPAADGGAGTRRTADSKVPETPEEGDPELPSADDQRKELEHLSSKDKSKDDAAKEDQETIAKALKKVAEASLKTFLKTKDGKKVQAAVEDALDKIPPIVRYGVPAAAIATALAGLALKHAESPITETPDLPLPALGPVKVTAKITWEGPVDKPTKSEVMFTFEIPLGPKDPEKKPDSDADALAREKQKLEDDLKKFKPSTSEELPRISGDPAPPLAKSARGASVLVDNFDVSKGTGKRAWNPDRLSKDIAKRSDGKTGRLQVVAYFREVESDNDDEDARRQSQANEDAALDNGKTVAKALGQLASSFKGRIDMAVQRVGSGRTFGLAGADAAALGEHEVVVIFVP